MPIRYRLPYAGDTWEQTDGNMRDSLGTKGSARKFMSAQTMSSASLRSAAHGSWRERAFAILAYLYNYVG
jgi:hypothetical protein